MEKTPKLSTPTSRANKSHNELFKTLKELTKTPKQDLLKEQMRNPFLRNRTNRGLPSIEGMQHGWFGRRRSLHTDFGSPWQKDKFHEMTPISTDQINNNFKNQYGIDFETKSLKARTDSVLEIALQKPITKKGKSYTSHHGIFIQQEQGYDLAQEKFLNSTGLGDINRKERLDLSKVGPLNAKNFHPERLGEHVKVEVLESNKAIDHLKNFMLEAKERKKNVLIWNANFEISQAAALTSSDHVIKYSAEYVDARKRAIDLTEEVKKDLNGKLISKEVAFDRLYSNQMIKFNQIMIDATKGGAVIDLQEIAKTFLAVSQNKGLMPKTGNFGVGTNVRQFADMYLPHLKELHEGMTDNDIQAKLAPLVMQDLQDISSGKINAKNLKSLPENRQRIFNHFTDNLEQIHRESLRSAINQTFETNGNFYNIDPSVRADTSLVSNDKLNLNKIYKEEYQLADEIYNAKLTSNKALGRASDTLRSEKVLKNVRTGSMILGGGLLASAIVSNLFSGRDDDANTIEGLRHGGVAEQQRKKTTAFGSGYQMQKFHNPGTEDQEPQGFQWKTIGSVGLGAAGFSAMRKQVTNQRLNDVTYLGQLEKNLDNETLLGREFATIQDRAVAGIRRLEASAGGLPRAFGIGDVLSYGMYDSANFSIDLTTKSGESYAKYMDKILKRKISEEGVQSIMFNKGEVFLTKNGKIEKLAGQYSLIKTVTDHNQVDNISSFAKSHLQVNGISSTKNMSDHTFLIIGGNKAHAAEKQFANAYAHESLTKPLKLLSDPFEALRDLAPALHEYVPAWAKKINKFVPNIGLDGKELVGSIPQLLGRHGAKMLGVGAALYYGFGTLNWGAQQLGPDGTPLGDAGLLGVGASAIRGAHETYARFSDITGLTSLRNYVEEKAPGMDGWQSTIGLSLSGAMFGGLYGTLQDVALEGTAIDKYSQFIKNSQKTEKFEGALAKIFKGEMTNVSKKMKLGGLAGFALALPFTIAGFGAEKSAEELGDEYSGRKEVAVRKGRFWESSFTPWEGGEIDYYRPNWYVKMMDNAKEETLGTEGRSPIGKTIKGLLDPYWLEKKRYNDQPYAVAGPDGSMLGIFGAAYESSIGRILKPVATMHDAVLPDYLKENTEYDLTSMIGKQWDSLTEFTGLRGFVAKTVKEDLTGSPTFFDQPNEARSAKDIDSITRDFYDLQIGGGVLTTEALRRVFQNNDSFQKAQMTVGESLNPIRNNMPSWMPGSDYYQDFKHGDPYLKIKDGYSRLPGAGYANKYSDLEGVNPEDYSDIHKYKILSDVAYGSMQQRAIKGKLQNRELTSFEQNIFDEVQRQVDEKNESKVNVRDPSQYDSFLGRYSAMVTDLARSNPLETLLPFSPAHKFLGPPDVDQYMDEQRYSKEYRNWANPISDFVLPTVSMTMNNLGMGGIDLNSDQQEIESFQDKADYLKFSNMARDAQSKGDLKAADQYTQMAQKTYTGADVFAHHAEVAKTLPKHERNNFNYFVGADRQSQHKMMNKVSPQYRDAYAAQLNKQIRAEASVSKTLRKNDRTRMLEEADTQQRKIRNSRSRNMQNLRSSPNDFTDNRARDYHDYSSNRESSNQSSIRMATESSAQGSSYASHYADLASGGIENALVVIQPGLDDNASISIAVDRTDERNELLRDWDYIA